MKHLVSGGLIGLLLLVIYYSLDGIRGIISDVLADNMIKGAFVMGLVFSLKDQFLVWTSFLWNVSFGSWVWASLKISNDSDNKVVYTQVAFWLYKEFKERIPNKKANTEYVQHEWLCDQSHDDSFNINFNPDDGVYLLHYKNTMISLNISSHQLHHGVGFDNKPNSVTSFIFTTLGWNSQILETIITDSKKYWDDNQSRESTTIRQAHPWWPQGKLLVSNPKINQLDHIFLDEAVEERLLKILNNFKDNMHLWHQHKQSYRESILLVGPPGNGKTKLLSFIAGYLGYDIMLVNLSAGQINDDGLLEIFARVPRKTLIALEEIDSAIPSRDVLRQAGPRHKNITMSGLLQALDGPVNKEGPIVVATTNRYEQLDSALIRPGRFNHHIKIDWSSAHQQERLLKYYFPEVTPSQAAKFSANLTGRHISCVTIVSYLRIRKADPDNQLTDVIEGAKTLKASQDVTAERIHLDSPIQGLLSQVGVSELTTSLICGLGITTLRQFKFASISDIYAKIEEVPKYKISLKDETILYLLQEEAKEIRSDATYLDYSKPNRDFLEEKKISKDIVEILHRHNFTTLGSLHMLQYSDFESIMNKEKEEKEKQEKEKEEKEKKEKEGENAEKEKEKKAEPEKKIHPYELLLFKTALEECTKAQDIKDKKMLSTDLLVVKLDEKGVSKETQKRIEKMGIETLRHFTACGVDKILGKFRKPKHKLSVADKTRIAQASEVISERIEEKEILV